MMEKKLLLDFWVIKFKSGRKFYKTADLMKESGLSYAACRAAISRLIKRGLLARIGKELFGNVLAGFSIEEAVCRAYPPSYLSCEYALSRHGVIDRMPVTITAVTQKRSKRCKIGRTEVAYAHMRKNFFWGFSPEGDAFVAEPEKALLDWLYLNERAAGSLDEINWDRLDIVKLKNYASRFPPGTRKKVKSCV